MIVIIGFVLERQPCLSEWQVAESFPVTPNDSDQEYALNITPKLYWPDSTTLQYNSIDIKHNEKIENDEDETDDDEDDDTC